MTYPKLCRECIYSYRSEHSYSLQCTNPIVNATDPYALSNVKEFAGGDCLKERQRGWFGACGKAGRLWEEKK
jgi:hypothetical protein